MLQKVQQTPVEAPGGGLVTLPNFFSLRPNQTPNCMNVKFGLGGTIEKRLGMGSLNSVILMSTAVTGFSPDSGGTLSTGLQAFWKLNEQSGSRLDSFGSNHLTDNNSVGFGVGILANAASFAAANSMYLSVPDNAALSMGNFDFSVMAWVNLNDKNSDRNILGKGLQSVNSGAYILEYSSAAPDRFRFIVNNNVTGAAVTDNTLGSPSLNTWYMVVGIYDSANGLISIQVNTLTATSASYTSGSYDDPLSFEIGRSPNATPPIQPSLMDGRIDEVGVWKKVLSVQERRDLWNGGLANTYDSGVSNTGFGMFDFGAGFVSGAPLRWLVVSAGTGVFASSNRGVSFVTIATDRRSDYQSFERSRSFLIFTANTMQQVLYWAGSVGTFALPLAVASAPAAKYARDFSGFLLLMNDSGGGRRITYSDNTLITTDPWTNTFELPSSQDDEITGSEILNKRLYVFSKYKTFRVSHVGGNPDFAYQEVKNWGAVPATIKKITLPEEGEVIVCLGWDKRLRVFDGIDDRIVSDPIQQSNGQSNFYLDNININQIHKSFAEVDTNEQTYKLGIVLGNSANVTFMLCWNYRTGAFYPYSGQLANRIIMVDSQNTRSLIGAGRDGFIYQMDSGNRDQTIAINEFIDSPLIFGESPSVVTKGQKINFFFSATSSGNLYFQDRTDYASVFGDPRDRIILSDTTSVIQVKKTIDIPLTYNVYQYRLSSSSSTATPYKINYISYENIPLGIGEG